MNALRRLSVTILCLAMAAASGCDDRKSTQSSESKADSTLQFRPATTDELKQLGLRTPGALVVQGVPAALTGKLTAGDIIAFAGDKVVKEPADLIAAVTAAAGKPVEILLYRNGLPDTVPIPLTAAMLPAGNQAPR